MWYPLTNPIPMVLWSYGPMVLWSYGPMVLWSYGGVSALYKVQNEVIWNSPTISSNRWRFHKQKRLEVVWRTEINLKSPTEFGRQSTKNPLKNSFFKHISVGFPWIPGSQGAWCGEASDTWSWTRRSSVDLSEAFPPRRRRQKVFAVSLGVSATDDEREMTQVTSTILLVKSVTCGKTPILLP